MTKIFTTLTVILIISDLILAYYNFQLYGNQETQSTIYGNQNEFQYQSKLPQAEEVPIETLIYNLAGEYKVDPKKVLKIVRVESNFDPLAVNYNTNGTIDKGLFQINSVHKLPDDCLYSKVCNSRWAIKKMALEGFGAWESSRVKWE